MFGERGDWGWIDKGIDDPDYDVLDDQEELDKVYTCEICGREFTLGEAISEFTEHVSGITYTMVREAGELCGHCAGEKYS